MTNKEILEEIKYNVLKDPFTTFNQDSSYESVQIKATAIEELVKRFKNQQKEIKALKKITREYESYKCEEDNKIIIASKEYFVNGYFKEFLSDFVSKDKIKEKIEEYNKKCEECNFQNTGICKEFKAHYNCSIQSVLELLEELLGE